MPTLNWIGKEKVVNHHLEVPYRVLEHRYGYRADNTDDKSFTGSGNMIVHGDNLEALKALLPEYEGRVKCIYIDPPYNTGNEGWVYNDNVNHPKIQKWLGEVVGKQDEDFTRHDKWLCMMYPRLRLLQRLLSEDGSIVISIGFHELGNLLFLCREIFCDKQIVPVTIQTSGGKPSSGFNYTQEYLVFVCPKDIKPNALEFCGGNDRSPFEGLTLATFDKTQRPNQTYPIFVNEKTGCFAGTGKSLQNLIDEGLYLGEKKDFVYDYSIAPKDCVAVWPITSKGKECVWRQIAERLKNDWEKGYIKISKNKSASNKNKFSIQYLPSGVIGKIETGELQVIGKEEGVPTLVFGDNQTVGGQIPTIWTEKDFYTSKGTELLKKMFPEIVKVFDYPKALVLIQNVISAISDKNSIILDSFAGSGTTAHAVLNLNKKDGGNRKFILVEMEDYADSITAERVRRVMNGYADTEGTGGCFDFYELGETLFNADGTLNETVGEDRIREYVFYTETKQHLSRKREDRNRYLLDTWNGVGYYLYYEPNQETAFTYDRLSIIGEKAERYIVYADTCTIDKDYLTEKSIIFRKIPRDITKF